MSAARILPEGVREVSGHDQPFLQLASDGTIAKPPLQDHRAWVIWMGPKAVEDPAAEGGVRAYNDARSGVDLLERSHGRPLWGDQAGGLGCGDGGRSRVRG